MKLLLSGSAAAVLLCSTVFLTGCSTDEVADTRHSGVERRQDRMDSRYNARQDRWRERGAREDARAQARLDSW